VKRVLVVFETAWDRRQLEACRPAWEGRFELESAAPSDEECPWDCDVPAWVERVAEERAGRIDGVLSSSDYPGATAAAALATRMGLPGSPPAAILRAAHKYYSRIAQRDAAPDATPAFDLVDPDRLGRGPSIGFPCFVKPVKGAFSVMARKVRTRAELGEFLGSTNAEEFRHSYVHIFDQLVRRYTDFEHGGGYFLAEEVLHGRQATIEGWVADDEVQILGIVDSILHPGTKSFARFDYPSALPADIQERMAEISRRVVRELGLAWTLFNIEMIYEPFRNEVKIIEINPRVCGQFADLYAKVDGTSGYEIALQLAVGERPEAPRRRAGRYRVATSFPLRVYEPVRVERVPSAEDVRAAAALFPETLVWNEIAVGQDLSTGEMLEDGKSFRYGVVNLGGGSRTGVRSRFLKVRERLGYGLAPIRSSSAGPS
jgi:biotin carboxylase